jgi:hypothetical protein
MNIELFFTFDVLGLLCQYCSSVALFFGITFGDWKDCLHLKLMVGGCSSVAKQLPSMFEDLGSIPIRVCVCVCVLGKMSWILNSLKNILL